MQKGKGIVSMWIEHIILGAIGLVAGATAAAGTFAIIIVLGVVPRLIGKCQEAERTLLFENAIILGGIFGNTFSIFTKLRLPLGSPLLMVYGLCVGIFVGCMAVALAEILDTFPIVFRRLRLKMGLPAVIFSIALGKLCGALFYFIKDLSA